MKKIYFIFAIIIFICIFISRTVYGINVKITEENLNNAFQSYKETGYEFEFKNNKIIMSNENESYEVDYDLTNKPTFYVSIPINSDMTYEQYSAQSNNLLLPMTMYCVVAEMEGADGNDALGYIIGNMTSLGMTPMSQENFNALNFVQEAIGDKKVVSDEDKLNSYIWTMELNNITSSSCNLISKIEINSEADFSKIGQYIANGNNSGVWYDITQAEADYVITLNKRQRCLIKSDKKIIDTGCAFISTANYDKEDEYSYEFSLGTDDTHKYGMIRVDFEDGSRSIIWAEIDNSDLQYNPHTIALYIGNKEKNITKENADYCVELVAEQDCFFIKDGLNVKLNFKSDGNLINVSKFEDSMIKICSDYLGEFCGVIYDENDKSEKTVFIDIKENKEGKECEAVNIRLDINNESSNAIKQDNTQSIGKLPQTGASIGILVCIILVPILIISYKKLDGFKDISNK